MNLFSRLRAVQNDLNIIVSQLQEQFGGSNITRSQTVRRYARGRTQSQATNNVTPITRAGTNTGKRRLTAAARHKMSLAAKRRWAEKKAA